jgi:phage nucleotide-binding protein
MSLVFTSAEQSSENSGIKVLVYGPSGIGKTVLAATLPSPVLLSAESGSLSLKAKNLERMYGVGNPNVTYNMPMILIRNVQDLTEAYKWASESHEAKGFQSIGLDSLSEIAETVLNNAKRQVKDPRQAYGELIEKMESVIRLFRDLPNKHVYMSAKMEPNKDELTGITKYVPSMPGKQLSVKLPYFFDEVFRLGVNKDAQGVPFRFLQTQPDLQYEAKDRSGSLDPMEYPFLSNVFSKILGV